MIYEDVPLEVGLGFEYCMGGVEVNEKMETSVKGLYTAGEASSGVFGACRVGDGLVEMLCQGMRAGLSAAEYCAQTTARKIDETQKDAYLDKILGYFDHTDGIDPLALYSQIEQACDEGFSVIRCEEKLQEAYRKILALKMELKNATLENKCRQYNNEWLWAIQAENLLTCCEAGIQAAIARKESRGCHMRKDYPALDHEHYLVKYVFSKENENMKMEIRQPVVTRLPLPGGSKENVIQYFMDKDLNYKR